MIPIHIKIGAKALVIYLLLVCSFLWRKTFFNLPYLPFVPAIDALPNWFYSVILLPIFLVSGCLAIWGYKMRLSLIVFGTVFIFAILSSAPLFSNSLLFAGVMILLAGLFPRYPFVFHLQIAILYIGAAINKIFDKDWWNGQYFDMLATVRHPMPLYNYMATYFEGLLLAEILGIMIMSLELILAALFLVPKFKTIAVTFGLSFHFIMLALTMGKLSISFLYIMSCAYCMLLSNFKKEYEYNFNGKPVLMIKSQIIIYAYFATLIAMILMPPLLTWLNLC